MKMLSILSRSQVCPLTGFEANELVRWTDLETRSFRCNDPKDTRPMDGRQSTGYYFCRQANRRLLFSRAILPHIGATQDYEARGMGTVWDQSVRLLTTTFPGQPKYTDHSSTEANQLLTICIECL